MSASSVPLEAFFRAAHQQEASQALQYSGSGIVTVDGAERDSYCCGYFTEALSQEELTANFRTRQAFERAVRAQYSPARVDRLCERYNIDFAAAARRGDPLLVDDVVRVGIGGARILAEDLQAIAGGHRLTSLSRTQITGLMNRLQQPYFIGPARTADRITAGPDGWRDFFRVDLAQFDKKALILGHDAQTLIEPERADVPDLPFLERFGKVAVSLELDEGEIIPAPGRDGQIDYFVVYRKISTGDGLVAYALKPLCADSELKPSLFFRPTQVSLASEDVVESWFNDCEERIGDLGYSAARQSFYELFTDRNFVRQGQKVRVVAYSLGATQASRLIADEITTDEMQIPDGTDRFRFDEHISQAILMNGPSMDQETADNYAARVNVRPHSQETFLELLVFRNQARNPRDGDHADAPGRRHIGFGIQPGHGVKVKLTVFTNVPPTGRIPGLRYHTFRPSDPANAVVDHADDVEEVVYETVEALTRELDNFNRGPQIAWYERTRQFWGTQVLYRVIYVLYALARTILSCLGIQLFRSSRRLAPFAPPVPFQPQMA